MPLPLLVQGISSTPRSSQQSSYTNCLASIQKYQLRYIRKPLYMAAYISSFINSFRLYIDITKKGSLNASATTLPLPIKLLVYSRILDQSLLRYFSRIIYLTSIAILVEVINTLYFILAFLSTYKQLCGKQYRILVRQACFSAGIITQLTQTDSTLFLSYIISD